MKRLLALLSVLVLTVLVCVSCANRSNTDKAPVNDTPSEDSYKQPEGSVVWTNKTQVYIIPSSDVDRAELEVLQSSLDKVVGKATMSMLFAEEEDCELIVGYVDNRAASVKAYRILERMEKEGYFDARYVIYAENNSVAIAFDKNEYSTIQAYTYAIDAFVNGYVEGKKYIA